MIKFSKSSKTGKLSLLTVAVLLTVIFGMCSESLQYFNLSFVDVENRNSSCAYSYLHLKAHIGAIKTNEKEGEKEEEDYLESFSRSGRRLSRLNEEEIYPLGSSTLLSHPAVFRQYLLLIRCLILISPFLLICIIYIHNQDGLK